MTDVRSYLASGAPLLFDGAMGTLYAAQNDQPCEQANLTDPEAIAAIHRAYLQAGAMAIKTNTFGAADQMEQIIPAACRIAQQAAEPFGAFVFGDIGPAALDGRAAQRYMAQMELFLRCGVTCFLMETLSSDEGVAEAARFLKQRCPQAYLIVSFAVGPDGVTHTGQSGAQLLRDVRALPQVDAAGLNCVSGPGHLLSYVKKLGLTGLSVMPNAGYPTVLGRHAVFMGTPEYFGDQLAQIARSGACIVGGCCGTTPDHIRSAAQAIARLQQEQREIPTGTKKDGRTPRPNPLAQLLDEGKRVIAVELDPPEDDDIRFFMDGVRTLRDAGADVVTIADCPVARPRADSSLLACKIKRELGMEPLPHMTCRDRNLNATKALLLGLSMEDVHNVLLVTGDPLPTAERDEVKSVYNFNSRRLAQYVSSLNRDVLTTPFRIFGALNLNAVNFDMQLKLAQEKEESGVSGFLTQPVLSQRALDNLIRARQTLQGRILGGIYPVVSHRNACFLNNEISGMHVCDDIVRLYEGKTREEAEELAVRICEAVAQAIAPHVDGYYLMTPFKRVALIQRILQKIRA